jgi:hypothetical protein
LISMETREKALLGKRRCQLHLAMLRYDEISLDFVGPLIVV